MVFNITFNNISVMHLYIEKIIPKYIDIYYLLDVFELHNYL
jgi:hypothetical protein